MFTLQFWKGKVSLISIEIKSGKAKTQTWGKKGRYGINVDGSRVLRYKEDEQMSKHPKAPQPRNGLAWSCVNVTIDILLESFLAIHTSNRRNGIHLLHLCPLLSSSVQMYFQVLTWFGVRPHLAMYQSIADRRYPFRNWKRNTFEATKLVGGFNPSEKY